MNCGWEQSNYIFVILQKIIRLPIGGNTIISQEPIGHYHND
jgi:hypothetical protein